MSIGGLLAIILILVLIGAIPTGGYGYGSSLQGGIGLVVLILVILLVLGRI